MQAFFFGVKTNPTEYLGRVELIMSPKKFYTFIETYKP